MSDRWTQHNMDKCGVAWWKMDESSGNIIDSKNGFTGSAYNISRLEENNIRFVRFNGVNSYISFTQKILPIGKKTIIYHIRLYSGVPSGYQTIMTQVDGGNYALNGIACYINNTSIGFSSVKGTSMQDNFTINAPVSLINDNNWHVVMFQMDNTTEDNGVRLYIDNLSIPVVSTQANEVSYGTPSYNLMMGRANSSGRYYLKVDLKNIQVYDDIIDPISKYYFIQTNDNKIWTYNTAWQDTGMVIGDLDYTNVSAKSNFETYGMFADEDLSSQALQDLKGMGYTSYRVLMGKM